METHVKTNQEFHFLKLIISSQLTFLSGLGLVNKLITAIAIALNTANIAAKCKKSISLTMAGLESGSPLPQTGAV